jgi:hypothetical protein
MTETRAQYVTGDPAALVTALKAKLRTWQAVADACNNGTRHSAGYYQQVASGRIRKPRAATVAGIRRAVASAETLLKCPVRGFDCGGLTLRRDLWQRARDWKNARNLTWDEWAERAQAALEEVSE